MSAEQWLVKLAELLPNYVDPRMPEKQYPVSYILEMARKAAGL